jgi:transcription elongation factor Elf1
MLPSESEEIPFTCPYCEKELKLPQEAVHYITCDQCGKRFDLPAQLAFNRGVDAFQEGHTAYEALTHHRKKVPAFDAKEKAIVRVFEEAYFSIQQAFTADLAEPQRIMGVEMMVNIAQFLLKRDLISGLESSYWGLLMTEHVAQEEYDTLGVRLAGPAGMLGFLRKMRWQMRRGQLRRALGKLDQKIRRLEENMAFTYPIHARKSSWKVEK